VQLRRWVSSAVLIATALPPSAAAAQDQSGVVAVLPLEVADQRLAIYSKPVADAVAQRLRSDTSLEVESLSLAGSAPARVSLVVDGRIVADGKRKVKLEARVRDPLRGKTIVRALATDSAPLARIDELARALAADLSPRLVAAVAEQKRARAVEKRVEETPAGASPDAAVAGAEPLQRGPGETPTDHRPGFLVIRAGGKATERDQRVSAIATRAGDWLVERLDHRPVRGEGKGVPRIESVRAQLGRAGLQYALMLDVREVDYEWRGRVLSARGRVRVVVVDANGTTLFDRTARTGTQVGSRGDGHVALAHYVAIQAIDIVAPYVKRLMAQ